MDDLWKISPQNELAADIQQVFVSSEDLQKRVRELGQQISIDYQGKNQIGRAHV